MIRTLLVIVTAAALLYAVSIGALWLYARRHRNAVSTADLVRLAPDVLRFFDDWQPIQRSDTGSGCALSS